MNACPILALNPGSTSLRFLVSDGDGQEVLRGTIASIGSTPLLRWKRADAGDGSTPVRAANHEEATQLVLELASDSPQAPRAAGVRFVHGGDDFSGPVRVDAAVLAKLASLERLAPLHNRPGIATLRALETRFGTHCPRVAVFDTAFHASMPATARAVGIPLELAQKHGIRRYGFHGLALESVLERFREGIGARLNRHRMILLHLGGGCSATAALDERSVDTSMGFSPLEGLLMSTRSGDLDPAAVAWLAHAEGWTADQVVDTLNHRSGLLGMTGRSGDYREVERLAAEGAPRARAALDLFTYRIRKQIGAMAAVLGGIDQILFSGGIGEHSPTARASICHGLEWAGVALDLRRNEHAAEGAATISSERSRVGVHVIAADEERLIALRTAEVLAKEPS